MCKDIISYTTAPELQVTISLLLCERGRVSSIPSKNMLVVSDVARVREAIAALLR